MDYREMAEELLELRSEQLNIPANRQMADLEKGELFVLNYLLTHDENVYPKDLSKEMTVSTARIAVVLNNMEEKGLITRAKDEDDSRLTVITLTDEGSKEIKKKRVEVINSVAAMLKEIGFDDSGEFLRIQKKIVTNYLNQSKKNSY